MKSQLFDPKPVMLENQFVKLVPMAREHVPGLFAVGQEKADWEFLPRPCFASLEDTRQWVDEALVLAQQGEHIAFVIYSATDNKICGSTRYLHIECKHRTVEVGWTWLGKDYQRTSINTAAKLLLLAHGFEDLSANRIELKTDLRNKRSQQAIERLGAHKEGILRKHRITQNDFVRDTVLYSVIKEEWPQRKQSLLAKLA